MKIFIYGFPHSGTTILRKIIGDHPLVYEYYNETGNPPEISKTHVVFKCPILPDLRQKDCRRIMIIKNPYDIFGSLYLRLGKNYLSTPRHTISDYEDHVRHFLSTRDIKVRYEELFEEETRKGIFSLLGLDYAPIIERETYIGEKWKEIPEEPPDFQVEGSYHALYRSWQINQPFENMTGNSAIFLPEEAKVKIEASKIIQKLYDKNYIPRP
jgi:hypothetical protein